MLRLWLVTVAGAFWVVLAHGVVGGSWSDYYEIESIDPPEGVVPEVGGVDVLDDGRVVFVFHRGEVYFYEPEAERWTRFAEGLHIPNGVYAESEREVYITQYAEVTRLADTNGDGQADHYETVNNDFGLSVAYAEFHHGLVRDEQGTFYSTLNTASGAGAGLRYEMRGEMNPDGREGRMFSGVAYRGWMIQTTPDRETVPHASGWRSPNGLLLDSAGRFFITENEGDWVGTSGIFHVQQGRFHGHAPSIVWHEDWDRGVANTYDSAYFDRRRVKPAVKFPHGDLSNSPTEPVEDTTGGAFGPFAGQIFVGEMNHPHLIRVMFDEVEGQLQGAAVMFHRQHGLERGNNRMAFDHHGDLWTGKTHRERGWTGGAGMHRISWTGQVPMEVEHVSLSEGGFVARFTEPVDPSTLPELAEGYSVERYYYRYDRSYGSPKLATTQIAVEGLSLSDDGYELELELEELVPGYLYHMDFSDVRSTGGKPVMHPEPVYTLHRLVDGSDAYVFAAEDAADTGFDAAHAQRIGRVDVSTNHSGYTGRGYTSFQEDGTSSELRWHVDMAEAGEYELHFRYALSGDSRPLDVVLGERTVQEALDFAGTGGWGAWETASVQATLEAGVNEIALRQFDGRGANIDALRIERVD